MINVGDFESIILGKDWIEYLKTKFNNTWLFPTSSFHNFLICSTPANVVKELPLQIRICKCSYWGTWNKVTKSKWFFFSCSIVIWQYLMRKSHSFLFRKQRSAIYKTPGVTRNFFWRDAKNSANVTEMVCARQSRVEPDYIGSKII